MNFTRFLKSVKKLQGACIAIDNNRDGWAEAIAVAQSILNTRVEPVEIIDHLPHSITLHRKPTLTVRKMA